ncbi:hypothetical protein RCG23_13160 [Neobacillus sp. PS3-34]|uniref:hypothetical protein n=1 Tax=Neobacillus sp. PS3-34 TaxID=3070678 RepID=UPI0027DF5156|nr:hypothetical protein [Neobacillus sp. PS3-34]WML46605.1 hypothetical protein RCG23_13160 [Neobacillus sp. PS3-34]
MTWIIRHATFMCFIVLAVTVWDFVFYPGDYKILFMTWGIAYIIWSFECFFYFCIGVIRENYSIQ